MVVLSRWALDVVVYEVYMFRVSVNMWMWWRVFYVLASANHTTYTFAHGTFWNLDRCFTNCRMLIKLWTLDPFWRTKVLNVKVWIPT